MRDVSIFLPLYKNAMALYSFKQQSEPWKLQVTNRFNSAKLLFNALRSTHIARLRTYPSSFKFVRLRIFLKACTNFWWLHVLLFAQSTLQFRTSSSRFSPRKQLLVSQKIIALTRRRSSNKLQGILFSIDELTGYPSCSETEQTHCKSKKFKETLNNMIR